MKMIPSLLCIALATNCYAGVNGLTHHSRANCANNESISWDLKHYHKLRVWSTHRWFDENGLYNEHEVPASTFGQVTYAWRAAAVHWLESFVGNYTVEGIHVEDFCPGVPSDTVNTLAIDCNIYSGWWDIKDSEMPNKDDPPDCSNHLTSALSNSNEKDSSYAEDLLNYRQFAAWQFHKFAANKDPRGTELRTHVEALKLNFTFKPILPANEVNEIGIAPVNTYTDEGWTGAKDFFEPKSFKAVCAFEVRTNNGLNPEKGSPYIQSIGKYKGIFRFSGSKKTGYLYEVIWDANHSLYILECASILKDESIKNQMIELAANYI